MKKLIVEAILFIDSILLMITFNIGIYVFGAVYQYESYIYRATGETSSWQYKTGELLKSRNELCRVFGNITLSVLILTIGTLLFIEILKVVKSKKMKKSLTK